MSKRCLLLFFFCVSALGGNESGGDWVANRYKAKAYEVLSLICRQVERKTSPWKDADVIALETMIAATPVSTVEKAPDLLSVDPKKGIALDRARWTVYFNLELDLSKEILQPYLGLLKQPVNPLEKISPREFHSRHLSDRLSFSAPQLSRDGAVLWALLPNLVPQAGATKACDDLNRDPKFGTKRKWTLPTATELSAARESLVKSLEKRVGLTNRHYQVWIDGEERPYDLLFDSSVAGEGRSLGLLCRGAD